jgi:predicted AlkP superfamily pyrophosphatase or phosphodiesterase
MKRLLLFFAIIVIGCQQPHVTVVWISIDGCRGDYVDRAETPSLHRLMQEGAYSKQLLTIVPSITFPSHASEATGVTVGAHGIPSNVFYDTVSQQIYKFPNDASVLQAEPIWITAQRQGVRTLVYDWPMAHTFTGAVRPEYYYANFDGSLHDEDRLHRIIDTWRNDHPADKRELRLIMGYITGTDPPGHKYGPESREVADKMTQVDRAIGEFVNSATQTFRAKAMPNDQLYVLISTDHGMTKIHTGVNLRRLLSHDVPANVQIVTEGPLGMIYLNDLAPDAARELQQSIIKDLKPFEFLDAFTRETLPAKWGFNNPTRTGDVIVMLKPGFTFGNHPGSSAASWEIDPRIGPVGMHGYPPESSPDMRGLMVLWRYPQHLGGRDLGTVSALQLHPTVAKLLGIKPANGAKGEPLPIAVKK